MKKYKEAIYVLLIVGLPVFFYLFLKSGKQNYLRLPIYGNRVYDESLHDTIFHTLSDFSLTDQTGAAVSLASFDTSIIVANFFFASCPDFCPKLNAGMAEVYQKTAAIPNVKYASFTVDPDRDSVPVLAAYAKRFHADAPRWRFITGSKLELYNLAGDKGMMVPVEVVDTSINHSQNLILIDPWRRVRGYYNGMDEEERKKLIDEIKVLQVEIHEKSQHE